MEVGKGTRLRVVGGEVLFEPPALGGTRTAAELLSTVAVERDDVPASQVVRVVPFVGVSGGITEVVEVGRGSSGFVLVISECWPCALLELAPGRLVALLE